MAEGRRMGEKKKVMVAMDESECSQYTLEWTLQTLHDTIANSVLVIFTAQPISDYSCISAYPFDAHEKMRNLQENQRLVATSLFEKAKEICGRHGVKALLMF
ncbi:unnamed protein product [Ilex paraguariensis]|uniref:UspA domain-containing protein n=1 Tax=Ilex paraguariensis TaxID=185542 RepID=A0ABC8S4P8_9AQUA